MTVGRHLDRDGCRNVRDLGGIRTVEERQADPTPCAAGLVTLHVPLDDLADVRARLLGPAGERRRLA